MANKLVMNIILVSLAQLLGILHVICRGRGSNHEHPTSPHLIVWALATRLLNQKKIGNEYLQVKYTMNIDVL